MDDDEKKYDHAELERLWGLDYDRLVLAPAESGHLREARFVMQAKNAIEARSLTQMTGRLASETRKLALATFVLALFTALVALFTALVALFTFIG